MLAFLLAGDNIPFTVSLSVMLGIAFLEGVSSLIGFGISGFLDSLVPDGDIDIPDSLETGSVFSSLLGWIRVGNIPLLALLVMTLTLFGLCGLFVQAIVKSTFHFLIPWYIVVWPVFFSILPLVRLSSRLLSRIVIREETDAVSEDSFVGQVATVTTGKALAGQPAEAKLKDRFGHTHYVMIEPDNPAEFFVKSEYVLLVSRTGCLFKAIRAPESIVKNI